ncbi:MAG: alpha/beta fold hydrolase [Eubacteriales bacterium]|jgi:alpha-beta hydrolase superfamily lysophospholipase
MSALTLNPFTLSSSAQGQTLHGTHYQPPVPPHCTVVIVHGMCEHRARYDGFARWLCAQGCAVVTYDQLGHGETASSPLRLGFFAPHQGWRRLQEDLEAVVAMARRLHPALPCVVLAHSMGSILTRCWLPHTRQPLAGCILMGTTGSMPLWHTGIGLCDGVIRRRGPLHRSKALEKMAFFAYNSRCHPRRTSHDWLSRENWEVDRYLADPLCTFTFTASAFRDLFTLVGHSMKPEAFSLPSPQLPLLLLAGVADPVGQYGRGPRWAAHQYRQAGMQQVSLQLYPGARHELLHESNRAEVCADIWQFLQEVCHGDPAHTHRRT